MFSSFLVLVWLYGGNAMHSNFSKLLLGLDFDNTLQHAPCTLVQLRMKTPAKTHACPDKVLQILVVDSLDNGHSTVLQIAYCRTGVGVLFLYY